MKTYEQIYKENEMQDKELAEKCTIKELMNFIELTREQIQFYIDNTSPEDIKRRDNDYIELMLNRVQIFTDVLNEKLIRWRQGIR
jgi:hypothetical protein